MVVGQRRTVRVWRVVVGLGGVVSVLQRAAPAVTHLQVSVKPMQRAAAVDPMRFINHSLWHVSATRPAVSAVRLGCSATAIPTLARVASVYAM